MKDDFFKIICEGIGEDKVRYMEPMKAHTSFRTGGPAKYFLTPVTDEEWKKAIVLCRQNQISCEIIGNGTNLLVSDRGIDGAVLQSGRENSSFEIDWKEDGAARIKARSGLLLSQLAKQAAEKGLAGLEFAAGIPGSLGGAIAMNAGAYGGEMKQVVTEADMLTKEGELLTIPAAEMDFSYRHSVVEEKRYVVLGAALLLKKGKQEEISAKMKDFAKRRKEKQPLEYPSAGSTFKRPQGFFAGELIMNAGLAGFQLGGARVSEKHCGFVINTGDALSADIYRLILHVQRTVKEKYHVLLETEVKLLGEF